MAVDRGFRMQMAGYGLLTAEISYYRPDHPRLLQLFVWQCHDIAPAFPELARFLDHDHRGRRRDTSRRRGPGRGEPGPKADTADRND